MSKIKIALFIDTYYPMIDGVVNVVDNYARLLNKKADVDVAVFCPVMDKNYKDNFEYKVVRCKSKKLFFLDYNLPTPNIDKKFKKAICDFNPDIVHIHSPFGVGKMALKYAKKYNKVAIATFHSQFKKDIYKVTKSKLITNIVLKKIMKTFNMADEGWAVNQEVEKLFKQYGYVGKSIVMNNATNLVPIEDDCQELDKKYNLKRNEKVFLFLGRINLVKNLLFIVDALVQYNQLNPNFKMLFVGDGQDRSILEKYIDKSGIKDKIIMCGKVTDDYLKSQYYKRADLFLFPSLYDSSSIVQIEAASQRTPTLFIEGAVTAGTVTPEVNGFVADNDAQKYAQKMFDITSNDKILLQVGQKAFEDLYVPWDKAVDKAYERYKSLLETKNSL